jgi:subtilisin family serine protease
MKVKVKDKYLNIRAGKPSLNAPCYQYLAPGSEIEVDGKLYKGDSFDGVDVWLKDEGDNYYWIGGVQHSIPVDDLLKMSQPKPDNQIKFDWFEHLNISSVWSTYKEKGNRAKVAILDTGYCFTNPDLAPKIKGSNTKMLIQQSAYPGIELIMDDQDESSAHGTRCASLVGALNAGDYLVGIAPEAELLIGKLSIDGSLPNNNFQYILDGISWAISNGADVISISYFIELSPKEILDYGKDLKNIVQGKNVLIFACAGNSGQPQITKDYYPASFPECISVGASTLNGELSDITVLSSKTILHAPGEQIESYNLHNKPTPQDGTSFSTPIVAAIAALAVSYKRNQNQAWDSKSLLKELIQTSGTLPGHANKKVINPLNLFKTLK